VFVPLDLLFRLVFWCYRRRLGTLAPRAGVRLSLVAVLVVVPFITRWIAGLVCLLAPVDRRVQAHSPTRDDAAPRRACRVAIRARRRFALLWMASCAVPFALLDALLAVLRRRWFGLHTWSGSLLMGGARRRPPRSAWPSHFCPRGLGPTMGLLCLGVGPILWMSSITHTSSARSQVAAIDADRQPRSAG
jgi:hypothetical protein